MGRNIKIAYYGKAFGSAPNDYAVIIPSNKHN